MTADGAATPPILNSQSEIRNPSTRIDFDLPCVKCDYNLRTRPADGVCPECATPIRDSLRPDLLRFADVRWLGTIRNGMGIALWTPIVYFGIYWAVVAFFVATQSFFGSSLGVVFLVAWLFLVLSMYFCVLRMLWGLFLITTPDPNRPGRDRELRVWSRRLGVASALFVGVGMLSLLAGVYFGIAMGHIGRILNMGFKDFILATGACLSGAAALILASLYLRRLARRGEVKGLIKMMTTLVWGSGALIVLGAASMGLSAWVMFARIGVVTVTTTPTTALLISNLAPCAAALALLAYGTNAIVALAWFRRVLAAERERAPAARTGPDPSATMSP